MNPRTAKLQEHVGKGGKITGVNMEDKAAHLHTKHVE